MSTIISAIIAAAASLIVSVINSSAQHKKYIAELEKHDALNAYRLAELEKKVDKHNNLVERTYHLEEKAALMEEKIKVANRRLEDIEKGGDAHSLA